MTSELLSTKEAADYLGISISTIYRMEQQGLISAFKTPGGQRRFRKSDLDIYIEASSEIQAPQNPSSYKTTPDIISMDSQKTDETSSSEVDNRIQLSLFPQSEQMPKISLKQHTKIWSHRHIDENADFEDLLSKIEGEETAEIHPKNDLNDLPGKEWVRFQSSWFLFNAIQGDLKEEREFTNSLSDQHPATYSPTMVGDFILFFTKKGQNVLDPFVGIGSTMVACDRTGRKGFGIELSSKYAEVARLRTNQTIINADSRNISKLDLPLMDFCITSPPYWDMLNRSTKDFRRNRESNGFDSKYSEENSDLGNLQDYDDFLDAMYEVFAQIYNVLKNKAYLTIIIKNVKKASKLYPVAWDLAKRLSNLYVLKDEKIWVQDKVKLAPYGYPHAWVSNIHHHYCLIFRKEEK